MNRLEDVARMFKALGDPTRLRIFDFLRGSCCSVAIEEDGAVRPVQGPTVGDICCHVTGLDKISSTMSFHLKELRIAGLIKMEKKGRFMVCEVNREALNTLDRYLSDASQGQEPCQGELNAK
jgi:ArsR family transcriptional regulator